MKYMPIIIVMAGIVLVLAGCAAPGKSKLRRESTEPDPVAVSAVMDAAKDVPAADKARFILDVLPLLQRAVREDVAVQQPSGAISPGTIERGADGSFGIVIGFLDKIDQKAKQLISQLGWVIYLGIGLVLLSLGLFFLSGKYPLVSQSGALLVGGVGFACFFIPSIVIQYGWIFALILAAWFAYFAWQNRKLVLKGAADVNGVQPAPAGVSRKAIAKASGSGLDSMGSGIHGESVAPPDDRPVVNDGGTVWGFNRG